MRRAPFAFLLAALVSWSSAASATRSDPLYHRARMAFEAAQVASRLPTVSASERARRWREAATEYEAAFHEAPARYDAPEGAFNAAYARAQIGEVVPAGRLFVELIAAYGAEPVLRRLERGAPATGVAPDRREYKERIAYIANAYDKLAAMHMASLDLEGACGVFVRVAESARLPVDKRRVAARNAALLLSALGREAEVLRMRERLRSLGASREELLDADFVVAGQGPGTRALELFYAAHRTSGSLRVVDAAYQVAKIKQALGDPSHRAWFARVEPAWESFANKSRAANPSSSPTIDDRVAEARLVLRGGPPPASVPMGRRSPRPPSLGPWFTPQPGL
jgi:hypothetical protein